MPRDVMSGQSLQRRTRHSIARASGKRSPALPLDSEAQAVVLVQDEVFTSDAVLAETFQSAVASFWRSQTPALGKSP